MHDIGNTFDPLFASSDLYGVMGLKAAIIEDDVHPQAYVSSRGISINFGMYKFEFVVKIMCLRCWHNIT